MSSRYSDINLNNLLTEFAVEAMGKGGAHVGDRLLPPVKVQKTESKYYQFSMKERLSDDYETLRAPGTRTNKISRSRTSVDLNLKQYGLREEIPDEENQNSDGVTQPEMDATLTLLDKIMLGQENRAIAKLLSGTYITNNGAASTAWNAASGVDIKGDIDAAKLELRKLGVEPNVIVVPPHIAPVMANDSSLLDRVKYTQGDLLVNGDLPPVVFGMNTIIPTAIQNEANPGVATASYDFVVDDNSVLVAFINSQMPNKRSLSLGYRFWRDLDGSNQPIAVYRWYDNDTHQTIIEMVVEESAEIVCTVCGYLITGAYS